MADARTKAATLTGIGFRVQHGDALLHAMPDIGWLELHSENYMVEGGPRRWLMASLMEHYPISLHGVGLSLGSHDKPCPQHLTELRALIDEVKPVLVSEHLAWTQIDGYFLADLLPVPLVEETLSLVIRNVDIIQQQLGRQILVENIASYGELLPPEMSEQEYLCQVTQATGCGLVLDVSNLLVNEQNIGRDPKKLIQGLDSHMVGEIHLGGHDEDDGGFLLDRHASKIADQSWALLELALSHLGPKPALIEWDQEIPSFDTLMDEATILKSALQGSCAATDQLIDDYAA